MSKGSGESSSSIRSKGQRAKGKGQRAKGKGQRARAKGGQRAKGKGQSPRRGSVPDLMRRPSDVSSQT